MSDKEDNNSKAAAKTVHFLTKNTTRKPRLSLFADRPLNTLEPPYKQPQAIEPLKGLYRVYLETLAGLQRAFLQSKRSSFDYIIALRYH